MEYDDIMIFKAEMDFDGLREDKVPPTGGVLKRYVEERAVPQATKQDAKCARPSTAAIDDADHTTQYKYNKNNVLTSITYPSGRVVNYTLDTAQRVSGVSMTKSGTTTTLVSSISYLPFGGITSLTYGNNLTLTQTYDNQYRLSSIIAGSVLNFTYGYDANGNITSITDSINPPRANTPGIPGTYSYPSTSNRLSDITGPPATTYTYDNNGNIITQNNRTFVYDLSNQITSILDNSTQIASYTYNGLRQRTKKIVGSDITIYHYDTQGHLIAETNASGQTLVEYVYLNDQPFVMIIPTEQVYYYHNDHLGTPQVMTNNTSTIAWKAAYNVFGNATVDTSSMITNNLRFPGQYYDTESGLHYNWNRYYDPNTGRYITADPIGLEGGVNVFGYVAGNPIGRTDILGLAAGVSVCVRPFQIAPERMPWWVGPNHAYIQIGEWSAGFDDSNKVNIPEKNPKHENKKCWPSEKRKNGVLPDGTKCECATDDQIQQCVKDYAKYGGYRHYRFFMNNCGDWVIDALNRCCLKGNIPYHIYDIR